MVGQPSPPLKSPLLSLNLTQSPLISSLALKPLPLMWRAERASSRRPGESRHWTSPENRDYLHFLVRLSFNHTKGPGLASKKKQKKNTPKVMQCSELKPDETSLFLPFPLPRKHQAHPVRFSEDGLAKAL